jgi:transposase
MDMPLEYGSYKTAWKRLKKWQDEGIWDRIFRALSSIREHRVPVYAYMYLGPLPMLEAVVPHYLSLFSLDSRAIYRDNPMPLSILIGPGNEHDSKKLLELVGDVDWKPEQLYADAAYDTEHIRRGLESIDIEPNIPVNPRNGKRPSPYNVELYGRMKPAVERVFGWIKSFRRVIIHLRYGI